MGRSSLLLAKSTRGLHAARLPTEPYNPLSTRKEEKDHGRKIAPFGFLKFSSINKRRTFILGNKQFCWKRILQNSRKTEQRVEWKCFCKLQNYLLYVPHATD